MSESIPPRVKINWRHKGGRKPPGVVICTRPSKWGNPFRVGDRSPHNVNIIIDAEHACQLYRQWLEDRIESDPVFLAPLRTATGLACACELDEICHVDVIREAMR